MPQLTRTSELLYVAPSVEPVTTDELKDHCRVSGTSDDTYLTSLITVARQYIEQVCWSSFVNQTWDYWWNGFSNKIYIPRPPFQSISLFQYKDASGTLTAVPATTYEAGAINQCPYVRLQYNQTWPTTRGWYDDVYMRVVTGYGATAASVPAPLKHAIKLLAEHLYWNRSQTITGEQMHEIAMGMDHLISPYRFQEF